MLQLVYIRANVLCPRVRVHVYVQMWTLMLLQTDTIATATSSTSRQIDVMPRRWARPRLQRRPARDYKYHGRLSVAAQDTDLHRYSSWDDEIRVRVLAQLPLPFGTASKSESACSSGIVVAMTDTN